MSEYFETYIEMNKSYNEQFTHWALALAFFHCILKARICHILSFFGGKNLYLKMQKQHFPDGYHHLLYLVSQFNSHFYLTARQTREVKYFVCYLL